MQQSGENDGQPVRDAATTSHPLTPTYACVCCGRYQVVSGAEPVHKDHEAKDEHEDAPEVGSAFDAVEHLEDAPEAEQLWDLEDLHNLKMANVGATDPLRILSRGGAVNEEDDLPWYLRRCVCASPAAR